MQGIRVTLRNAPFGASRRGGVVRCCVRWERQNPARLASSVCNIAATCMHGLACEA
jgi:hypothetical protein